MSNLRGSISTEVQFWKIPSYLESSRRAHVQRVVCGAPFTCTFERSKKRGAPLYLLYHSPGKTILLL
jgi:hypothetical protein